MRSGSQEGIGVKAGEIAPELKASVWKGYAQELVRDLVFTMLIVTLLLMGLTFLVVSLLLLESPKSISLYIGLGVGLLFCVYLISKEFPQVLSLRRDLASGKVEVITARPRKAIAVDLPDGQQAIALDCRSSTLVIFGDWWKSARRKEIVWGAPEMRRIFPSSCLTITRLPHTGRVLAVQVSGKRLTITRAEPMEPELRVELGGCKDSLYLAKPLDEVEVTQFTERESG